MKKRISILVSFIILLFAACAEKKGRYINLSDGEAIEIDKDNKTGYMLNKETKEPLYIYADTKNNDTIYGKTGKVINGHILLKGDNKYVYDEKLKMDESGAVKYKDDDYKMEIEKDGDIKIKDGNGNKIKIDGETGERKIKKTELVHENLR